MACQFSRSQTRLSARHSCSFCQLLHEGIENGNDSSNGMLGLERVVRIRVILSGWQALAHFVTRPSAAEETHSLWPVTKEDPVNWQDRQKCQS